MPEGVISRGSTVGMKQLLTDELLEEHNAHTNNGALPASAAEAVKPRRSFKLEVAGACAILKSGMSLAVDLPCECDFGTDLKPLHLDSRVRTGKIAKLGQNLQGFVVTAFTSQPAGRER